VSEGKSGGWNGGAAVVPARGAGYEQTALDSRAATLLSLALRWRVERARSRLRAAEARAWEERGRLVNKILSVAERQRSGMAAELHDGPIQSLTRLGLMLERGRLRLRLGQVEDSLRLLTDAQTALGDEVQSLRRIMATLRPPVLEERGLVSALCDYVEVVRKQAGINCTLSAKLPERLPEDQEIVLYRVAQEALTNVARHSRAASARVELAERADKVVLEVHDDGVGFDPASDPVGGLDHFGLASMRERVELAGGTWTVWSRKGTGTVLTATLPKDRVAAA
jgi:signal transduction histidine kinase